MKSISEIEILDQYQIQEATLRRLHELGLMPDSKSKRGRLVYPFNKKLDLTLRTAKISYYEISDNSLRLVPCFRAFLAIAIVEGAKSAWSILKRRGFFDRYKQNDLVHRWRRFKEALPKELKDFVTGASDEVTDPVENMMDILGIKESFYGPEKLKMPEIYDNLVVQQDVDALLLAGATAEVIEDLIRRLHHVEIAAATVDSYRHYYFDTNLLTSEDFVHHTQRFHPSSPYRKVVYLALTARSLNDFLTAADYPARLTMEDTLVSIMQPLYRQIRENPCGPLTEKKHYESTKLLVHIAETLEKYDADDAAGSGEGEDLLRLRHDAAVNDNQLVAADIPEEDFDTPSSSYRRDDQAEEEAGNSA